MPRLRPSRPSQAGLTLIELLVGTTIGLFVVAAAMTFTSHQTRWLGFTASRIDMDQQGRMTIELIADDLRHAGLGVVYDEDNAFGGLRVGSFTVPGGATFDSTDRTFAIGEAQVITDDLGLLMADEGIATIVDFAGMAGQVCAGGGFESGDVVTMVSEDGLAARTGKLTQIGSEVCLYGACLSGCQTFIFAEDDSYLSGSDARTTSYAGGEMFRGFKQVVWHVAEGPEGRGVLLRAMVTGSQPCSAPGCGGTAASDVETLQIRVWQWDPETSAWSDRTDAPSVTGLERIRVDVELVLRARQEQQGSQPEIALELSPGNCLPGPCGRQDAIPRRAFRTSVELRNAGRVGVRG